MIEVFTINAKYKNMTLAINVPHYQIRESTRVIHSCELETEDRTIKFGTFSDAIKWIVEDEVGTDA